MFDFLLLGKTYERTTYWNIEKKSMKHRKRSLPNGSVLLESK